MTRKHNKDYFYKFMTIDTAKVVLETSSLRWSKPSLFNDPFDHQVSFEFPYSEKEFSNALAKKMEDVIYGPETFFHHPTLFSKAMLGLREKRNAFSKEEILEIIKRGCDGSAELSQEFQANINSLITNGLNQSRLLCVSENKENVVMWSHYADSHKGVCIKLNCIEEVDNTLLAARPVEYSENFPVYLDINDQIDHITGERDVKVAQLIKDVAYIKHADWAYEKEWRVHRPHETSEGDYSTWSEDKRVFGSIYLGCRIAPNDAAEIISIAEQKYPKMDIYEARTSTTGFRLNFEKIK
jgi:hypothetical protein